MKAEEIERIAHDEANKHDWLNQGFKENYIEAFIEGAKSQSKEIGALRKQVHDYGGKLQDQKDLIEKQSKEIDELKKFKTKQR